MFKLISIKFTETNINKTNKIHQIVKVQNLCSKCPPFTQARALERLHQCALQSLARWWSGQEPPLPQQTFFQLLHIMDPRTVEPSWRISRRCSTPDSKFQIRQIGCHISDGVTSAVSLSSEVTHSHSLACDFIDVNITSPGKGCMWHVSLIIYRNMISIHLHSCVPKIVKIRGVLMCKRYCKK